MSMYYTVLLKYFCHQFFHKAYTIVMNIINLEGGGVQLNPLNPPLATALSIFYSKLDFLLVLICFLLVFLNYSGDHEQVSFRPHFLGLKPSGKNPAASSIS